MLSANNIAVVFSGETLFSGVSFKINKGDRIGLAGKNGAGKTTLMKVLSGDLRPDEGALSYDGDVKVGILRQDIDFEDRHTLLGEIESSFTEIKRIEKRLAEVNRELETRTDYQSDSYTRLIEELNDLTHKFDLAGGYTTAMLLAESIRIPPCLVVLCSRKSSAALYILIYRVREAVQNYAKKVYGGGSLWSV